MHCTEETAETLSKWSVHVTQRRIACKEAVCLDNYYNMAVAASLCEAPR
jgi:hypothetical protein